MYRWERAFRCFTALKLLGRETAFVAVTGQDHHIVDYAFGFFAAEIGKVGFRLGHGITLLFQKIKSQTISMEADHLAVETYLILAVQSNFHGKNSILLFSIKIAIAFLHHSLYILQSISMMAANPKAA